MPARDKYHDAVRNALIKDGWTITHDPFHLQWDDKEEYVTTEDERLIAAHKLDQNIAVVIAPCLQPLPDAELERSIDLCAVYRSVLAEQKPDCVLHLALPEEVVKDVFQEPLGRLLIEEGIARIIGFDPVEEKIIQWIS